MVGAGATIGDDATLTEAVSDPARARAWTILRELEPIASATAWSTSARTVPTMNWVLAPNHAKVWYRTVWAFLDHHVLGAEWETPHLLR